MDFMGAGASELTRFMDVAMLRHRVIASNLANANTPGFKAKELAFDAELTRAMMDGRATPEEAVVERDAPAGANGNSVRLETEMADMQKNALAFQMAERLLAVKVRHLRMAVTGQG